MYTGDGAVEERATAGTMFETVLQVNTAVLESTECLRCAELLARPREGVLGALAPLECSLAQVSKERRK